MAIAAETTSAAPASAHEKTGRDGDRAQEGFKIRVRAAIEERDIPPPRQATNGDEERYANYIGSYSKGLPHNSIGEVDGAAYGRLLDAAREGEAEAFEEVPLGGTIKIVNPMAGVAFDLEGMDSHQLAIGPPPALAGQTRAADMVELYWMALCREVNFAQYGNDPLAQAAAAYATAVWAAAEMDGDLGRLPPTERKER